MRQALACSDLALPLQVRIGLHTGEAELRQGDYYGSAVNRAARLMAFAAGGQVPLSAVTGELVRSELPDGVYLRDLGQRLKDLSCPERICQLAGAGLLDEVPALRSLNSLPNNLPLQFTNFIGRQGEIAETLRLLDTIRLLTLIGPGGSGDNLLGTCGGSRAALGNWSTYISQFTPQSRFEKVKAHNGAHAPAWAPARCCDAGMTARPTPPPDQAKPNVVVSEGWIVHPLSRGAHPQGRLVSRTAPDHAFGIAGFVIATIVAIIRVGPELAQCPFRSIAAHVGTPYGL